MSTPVRTAPPAGPDLPLSPDEAERILQDLAAMFSLGADGSWNSRAAAGTAPSSDGDIANLEAMYRTLVEQIPAVVFMAYLDRGIGETYVSPRIEQALGFTQAEWLQDPVRWYNQVHPDDQYRWSVEAAEMFASGNPLKSAYRVLARYGRVLWFQCEAKMIRRDDGRPWLIHGVGFDITDLKQAEAALGAERNVLSTVLDTVGTLVLVLSPLGNILRCNRACEQMSGCNFAEMAGRSLGDQFMVPDEAARFVAILAGLKAGQAPTTHESDWVARNGSRRRIAWSTTLLAGVGSAPAHVIAAGIDITERKRMERAILEISAREQRQIGQDLHDGLGQHLTGIAFLSKALEQKLAGRSIPETEDARQIVRLVNDAIHTTRSLARGLLPVVSQEDGLMVALARWAAEVTDLFHVDCSFECPAPVLVPDVAVATHLYHVAQEAVNNTIKHAGATHLVLSLTAHDGEGSLVIEDDGVGLPDGLPPQAGLGLHIMRYRASMVGGTLELREGAAGGTVVACRFPLPA